MPNDIVKTSSDIENVDWSTGTAHYTNVVRFGSSSSQASQSSGDICRICHCESDPQNPLLTPCYCSGSLKYVHQACLQQWLTASETNACELCKFPFIMHTKIKPFNEWRSLDMSGVERRRLCCAVLFHCAAAVCVIWSLCVLIERAAEEVKRGLIGWPFWTKLAVVTVGLTGGVVFMYIQCRQYLHLCHRWRARNRILLIQNAPEKIHPLCQASPILHSRSIPRNNSSIGCGGLPLVGGGGMTTNGYNYNMYGYSCTGGGGDGIDGNQMQFGPINQNIDNTSIIDKHNYGHVVPLHGKIIANIENCNSSENYDRDWTLDDQTQSIIRKDINCDSDIHNTKINADKNLDDKSSCNNSMNGSKQELNSSNSNNNLAISNNSTNNNNSHRTNDLDLFKTTINSTLQTQSLPATSTNNSTGGNNCNSGDSRSTISHPLELTDLTNNKSILKYPNSSVFVENRDILNDTDYPKINYRHSSVLTSPDITDNLDKFLGKDCRRYSDTKLLQTDTATVDILNPIFNVALNSTNNDDFRYQRQHHHNHHHHQKNKSGRNNNGCCGGGNNNNNSVTSNVLTTAANSLTGGEQTLIHNILGAPQITDIIFESATQLDPLELNIQEMLDMDLNQHYSRKKMRRSLNHFDTTTQMSENNVNLIDNTTENYQLNEQENKHQQQQQITQQQSQHIDKSRSFFKSLPNLSSSCESLIKK